MLKHRPTLRRLALPGIVAVLFAVPVQAYADEASALAELEAIRAVLNHADLDAQRRLEMVRLALPPDASEHLKRDLALTALRLRACTGAEGGAGSTAGAPAGAGATPGRPHIADALVASGVVAHRDEAFDRWLHNASPYYVRHYAP
ncbi:MAG: hypothetical protein ACXWVF_13135, partial [Telluria sp.]